MVMAVITSSSAYSQKPYKIKSDTLNLADLSITRNEDYLQSVNGTITLNITFEEKELREIHLSFPMTNAFFIVLPDAMMKVKSVNGIAIEPVNPKVYKVTPVGEGTLIFGK